MVKPVQTTFGSQNWLGKFAQKAVADLSNSKALTPVLLLEGSVLTGRCYHAKKRGGAVELKERFIEEFLTAIVWLFGITSLNKAGDFIAKKFNLDTTVDVGKDKISDEYGKLKEYMKSPLEKFTDGKSKRFKDILTGVKFTKIILCTLTGIYVVGSMIPKYKNSVTENDMKNQKQKLLKQRSPQRQEQKAVNKDSVSMQKFLESAKDSNTNFKGGSSLISLSHKLENDNIYKILTMDAGIIGGRSINSRNEDEKFEIVLRDISSMYFYMASTHHIAHCLADDKFNFFGNKNATGLNLNKKMGISTNLDPRIAEYLNSQILKEFDTVSKSKEEFNFDKFMTNIFGKKQSELVKILTKQATKTDHTMNLKDFLNEIKHAENKEFIKINAVNAAKLNNQVVTGSGVMRISRYLEELASKKQIPQAVESLVEFFHTESERIYKNTAEGVIDKRINNDEIIENIDDLLKSGLSDFEREKMGIENLKTHLGQVKPDGNFIVTAQIEDIVNDGLIRKQSFLNKAFSESNPDIMNPKKYVSFSSFNETKGNIQKYSECLKKNLEQSFKDKGNITIEDLQKTLKKFQNKNLGMKALYTSVGLGVSAYFLSSGIPKFQYYMTKKRTGNNEFPGVKGLNTAENK
ncbi:MAG: hypothetical protein PHC34_06895 [Candidatus Gastranaerophilales bacterium]|nr:hypothetical protein [Candidatus Gastranaerophilales bacterium]